MKKDWKERGYLAVHGHDRASELEDVVQHGSAQGVSPAMQPWWGFFSHAAATTNDDLKALIDTAEEFHGMGFLLLGNQDASPLASLCPGVEAFPAI